MLNSKQFNSYKLIKDNRKGIFWLLIKSMIFSLISIITVYLSKTMHVYEIFFLSMLFRVILLSEKFVRTSSFELVIYNHPLCWLRSSLMVLSLISWFYVVKLLPINHATAISYTTPLFTSLAACIILKERITLPIFCALITGFLGAIFMIKPGYHAITEGEILAFFTAIIWAITDVTSKVQSVQENRWDQNFYNSCLMVIISFPFAYAKWQNPNLHQFGWLWILAILFLINNISLYMMYKYSDIVVLAPFSYARLLFTASFSYILWQQKLTFSQVIGSIIIVLSSSYILFKDKKIENTNYSEEVKL